LKSKDSKKHNDLLSTIGLTLQEVLAKNIQLTTAIHILLEENERLTRKHGFFEASNGKKTGLFVSLKELVPYYKKGYKMILESEEHPLPYVSWAHDVAYPILDALTH
jgi:hypothetical protein